MEQVSFVILLFLLFTALILDFRTYKIPNSLIGIGLITGISLRVIAYSFYGIYLWFIGVGGMMLILYGLYYTSMIGAGDVKLFGVIGGCLGIKTGFCILIISFLTGAVIAVILLVKRHNFRRRLQYLAQYFHSLHLQMLNQNKNLPLILDKSEKRKNFRYMDMKNKDVGACMHFTLPVFISATFVWIFRYLF